MNKNKYLLIMRIAEFLVAAFIFVIGILATNDIGGGFAGAAIYMDNYYLTALVYVLGVLIAILVGTEYKWGFPWVRTCYLVFTAILTTVYAALDIAGGVYIIWLCGSLMLVLNVFAFFDLKRHKSDILPSGVFAKKDLYFNYISAFSSVLIIILSFLISQLFGWLTIAIVPATFIVCLVIYFLIVFKTNTLNKAMRRLNRTCDLDSFFKTLESISYNEISLDTESYIKTVTAEYQFLNDYKSAMNLFSTIDAPDTNKSFMKTYDRVNMLYFIYKNNKKAYEKQKAEYIATYSVDTYVNKIDAIATIILSKDKIENIEEIYSCNHYSLLDTVIDKKYLMMYYDTRGESDKAKKLAQDLIDLKLQFEDINNYAHKVLGE
ncbi:MAG: hypothetical protein K6A63_06705 [Acholeplasmatales bacterium]|nr:hypothetical protein [Acholeplasmatales bacterium]